MSIYILRLIGVEIIGARIADNSAVIPSDSVKVAKEIYDSYETIKQAMRDDGRIDKPNFVNDLVEAPTDTRTLVDISFNESKYKVGEQIEATVTLVGADTYSGEQFLMAFDDLYLFNFMNGLSVRNDISLSESGIYEFKNNATIRVQNPVDITIYK